jgi:hypothetical protein
MRTTITTTCAAVLALLAAGCGGAEIGEDCDTAGSADECVDGAICTNESSGGGAVCRETCDAHEDCPDGHSCNGVSGSSQKSCQPD